MALTIIRKPSDTSITGSAKELRPLPSANFLRTTSVEMVQLVQRNTKNPGPLEKPVVADTSSTASQERQLTSIQPEVVLRLSQETHKSKVFEIDLSGNAVKKIENIGGFTHLRILDLACNQIEKIENLNKNTELREIRLYSNRISRIENLELLKKLSVLKLQQNNIEQIGDSLQQQRMLEVLRLDSNKLCAIKPAEILPLQNLRVLNLGGNKLSDVNFITTLLKLETLDVSRNNIPTLPSLRKCSCLTEVNVSHNRLDSLAGLAENSQLVTLNVSNNALKSLRNLGQCKKLLENLYASGNQLESVDDLPAIAPNLEILDISKNSFSNGEKLLANLKKLEALVELKFMDNPVAESLSTTEIRQKLPKLEMINGVNYYKRLVITANGEVTLSARPQTPGFLTARDDSSLGPLSTSAAVLRPKTANTGLTIRQLDMLFNNLDGAMQTIGRSFSESFEKVVTTLNTEAPRCSDHAEQKCKSCMASSPRTAWGDGAEEVTETPTPSNKSESPQPNSPSRGALAKSQSTNALTRRLEHAKSYSMRMGVQTGGNKTTVHRQQHQQTTIPNRETTKRTDSRNSKA